MDFATLSETLLASFAIYGAPILAVTVLVGSLGLPLPSTTLLIAAGALTRVDSINPWLFVIAVLIAALVGDGATYLAGKHLGNRRGAGWLQNPRWIAARERIAQQGWGAIYLSRWLLTPLAVPLNVVAGASGFRGISFLSAEIAGDLTWVLIYGGAGYLLGTQWELASTLASEYGGIIALVAGAILIAWFAARKALQMRNAALPA